MKTQPFFIALLIIVVISGHCFGETNPKSTNPDSNDSEVTPVLIVGVAIRAPWSVITKDGNLEGLDISLMNAIEKKLGVQFEYRVYPWQRCLKLLASGELDILPRFSFTEQRQRFAQYVHPPYSRDRISFIKKADQDFFVKTISDLHGKRVGVLRGNVHTPEFDNDMEIQRIVLDRKDQLVQMLLTDRIDIGVSYELPIMHTLKRMDLENAVSRCPLMLERSDADYFAFSRKSKHLNLVDSFSKVLVAMLRSGEVERILKSNPD